MADETRRVLGDYEMLGHIGDGAQGKIFKAQCVVSTNANVRQGEVVAIKVIRRFGDDDKGEDRFRREVKNLISLKHPNIVEYKEAFTVQDELSADIQCLVMEFLDGEDLATRLNDFPKGLPFEQVKSILEQVLAGLAFARGKGLIHRDLKPANIFLISDGRVKVIDFGIARKEDGTVTTTAGFKGTYDYMAPDFLTTGEEFRGDELSDIFSIGVCLYKAMTGQLPYPSSKETGWMAYLNRWQKGSLQELAIPTGPLRVLNDRAAILVRKALKVDRSQRYGSFQEMMEDLKKVDRCCLQVDAHRYELESYLGKGGFGEVFRAKRVGDGKVFAVKHLFPGLDPSRFRREARLLEKYPHPNLVAYTGFTTIERLDGEDHYLVLEYLEGMPGWGLRARIKSEGALSKDEVIQLFSGYLIALDFLHTAHRKPILHRDITPANLYAPPQNSPEGEPRHPPKIFDLGIARSEQTMTGGHVPGNPEYMAPEFVLTSDFRGSIQSDIYCLGMCMYEALSGKPAYDRLSRETAEMWSSLKARAEGRVGVGFDLDVFRENPVLERIVRKSIARDPKQRFQSARELLGALKALGTTDEGKGLVAVADSPARDEDVPVTVFVPDGEAAQALAAVKGDGRKGRWWRMGVAAAALLLLLGGALYFGLAGGVDSAVKEVASLSQKGGEFRPTATHVGLALRHKERAEKLRARYRTSVELERAAGRIRATWEAMGDRFEVAFGEALDKDERRQARDIMDEWRASETIRVSGGVPSFDHKARWLSMESRLNFSTELAAVKGKSGPVTPEGGSSLIRLLHDARRKGEDEPVPSAKPWWARKTEEMTNAIRGLPDTIQSSFAVAMGRDILGEAEGVARAWTDLQATEGVSEWISAQRCQEVSAQMSAAVMEVLNKRLRVGSAAYSGGNLADGDAMSEWLQNVRETAPTVVQLSGEGYDKVLQGAVDAQAKCLEGLVAGIPRVTEPGTVKAFATHLVKIRDLYVKWSKRWPAADGERVRQGVVKRCSETVSFFGDEAVRMYGASKYDEGKKSQELARGLVEVIPAEFKDALLDAQLQEVARAHDRGKQQDKEVNDAEAEMARLTRMIAREDVDAWPAGLGRWGAVKFSKEVRATIERTESWQKMRQELERRLGAWVDEKSDGRSILAAQNVLNMEETRDILGDSARGQMVTRLRLREEIVRETSRLDNILASIRPDEPATWKKAVEDMGRSRQSDVISHKAVWDHWQHVSRACFDRVQEYANRAEPVEGVMARLKEVEEILKLARKGDAFDSKEAARLEAYVSAEMVKRRTASKPPEVAVASKPPAMEPVDPVNPRAKPEAAPGVTPAIAKGGTGLLSEDMAGVERLLEAFRVRDAADLMYGDIPFKALEQSRKNKSAVHWPSFLGWVKKQREDNPGLDIVGRDRLDQVEREIQVLIGGNEVPERLRSRSDGRTTRAAEAGGDVVKPAPSTPAGPPRPREMSAPLRKELAFFEGLVEAGKYKDCMKQLSQSLIKRCERAEKADPKTFNWESVVEWLQMLRRDHPELDSAGGSELDGMEGKLQDLAGARNRRR